MVLSFSIEAGCHEWEFADPTSDIWHLQSATEEGPALAPKSGGKSLIEKTTTIISQERKHHNSNNNDNH